MDGFLDEFPRLLGTIIRWSFYLGKKKFSVVYEEEWNRRVGFIVIMIAIAIIANRK